MNFPLRTLWIFLVSGFLAGAAVAEAPGHTFNRLVQEKASLETRFGVATLECFPFVEHIGRTEDQVPLIERCLRGTRTLGEALEQVPDAGIRMVGVSDRFLRTGGFQTLLMPWDANREALVQFLKNRPPPPQQQKLFDAVRGLKQQIAGFLRVGELYCSLKISNPDCVRGYQNLAGVEPDPRLKKIGWRTVVITDAHTPQEDPHTLTLDFRFPPEKMKALLVQDLEDRASRRRQFYETLNEKFGRAIQERLQLPNLFCAPDLSREDCLQGAENLAQASQSPALQNRFWGRVTLHRYNTIIEDDFDATLRFDLSPETMVQILSAKPTRETATANAVRAEKLERRTKNNPTRLRAVCDLDNLTSSLCAHGFQTFIDFVKKHRDYRVAAPWTNIMFVDGAQLSRVNFALNSKSRDTYIFIDAASSLEEFERVLIPLRETGAG